MRVHIFIVFLSFIAINSLIFIVIADKLKCNKNETYSYRGHSELIPILMELRHLRYVSEYWSKLEECNALQMVLHLGKCNTLQKNALITSYKEITLSKVLFHHHKTFKKGKLIMKLRKMF